LPLKLLLIGRPTEEKKPTGEKKKMKKKQEPNHTIHGDMWSV
jgi:hypothetical protein